MSAGFLTGRQWHVDFEIDGAMSGYPLRPTDGRKFFIVVGAISADDAASKTLQEYQEEFPSATVRITTVFESHLS